MKARVIKKGQIWFENDRRFQRFIRVVEVGDERIQIEDKNTGRRTSASRERFNGKSGGYSYVSAR